MGFSTKGELGSKYYHMTQNRKLVFSSEDSAKLDFVGDTQASYDSGITLNSDFENHKEPQISNFLVR